MATNFSIGDDVIPNQAYIEQTLSKRASTPQQKQTVATLQGLIGIPCEITAIDQTPNLVRFVKLLPSDTTIPAYKNGLGVVVYFSSDTVCNNSLEKSTAYLKDKCFTKVLNSSGSPITKLQLLRQVGFDSTMQLPTVGLADATTVANAVVLGVAMEDIADGAMGTVLTDGSYQADTSSYAIGAQVYVSDTPGAISSTAGTEDAICGRVLEVATDGTISFFSTLTGGGSGAAAGGGFFTDGTGTDAAIGKGATAPTAAGANSFAHGDNSSANSNNSFAAGQDCVVNSSSINTFTQGFNCRNAVVGSYDCFAQGNNVMVGPSGFSQGTNVLNYGSWTTFAQGYSMYIESYGAYNTFGTLAQGYNQTVTNSTAVLTQGYVNSITSNSNVNTIRNALVQGENNTIYATSDVSGIFIQGKTNNINNSHSFAQGESNTIDRLSPRSFIQGLNNDIGIYNTAGAPNPRGSENSFVQGYNNRVFRDSPQTFAQGKDNQIGGYTTFGQGRNNYMHAYASFVQGGTNIGGHSGDPAYLFLQGGYNTISGYMGSTFVQGGSNNIYGPSSGGSLSREANFIQGFDNTFGASSSTSPTVCFIQGRDNNVSSAIDRAFGQGRFVKITRDDQKTWGSNRSVLGAAQSSKIVKHLQTTSASQTTIITLDLEEDKAYSIKGNIAARNTTTNAEVASFIINQAIAYRDTAGAAVLVGSPVPLTRLDSGGGATSWLADLASSGNNILLRVTGDSTDTVEWCADFEFVEVAG
jgi:hypothetical protein